MEVTNTLTNGGVAVIATDTIYGIVGQALKPEIVERIYTIKRRTPSKPFIILVDSPERLLDFGVTMTQIVRDELANVWPGPVSVIVPCNPELEYLHRGTNELAFRLPSKTSLRERITMTGPLVAPSANPEGFEPANNIEEAKAYFNDEVDAYESGEVTGKPSRIIRIVGDQIEVIRA
jgi:L-threonylcarbamoyladenylate synthase